MPCKSLWEQKRGLSSVCLCSFVCFLNLSGSIFRFPRNAAKLHNSTVQTALMHLNVNKEQKQDIVIHIEKLLNSFCLLYKFYKHSPKLR